MKGVLKCVVWLVGLICYALLGLGGGASSSSSEVNVSCQTDDVPPIILNPPPPSTNSLLPITPKRDTALVAAPDGMIYLVEVGAQKVLWSFTSGSSIYSSYQTLPNYDGDQHNSPEISDNFFIDCGDDWELYMLGGGFKKKLPLSAEELIRSTPYVSADGGVMLGSKKTTVFLVDAKTGRVVHSFKSDEFPSVGDPSVDENSILPRDKFEEWTEPSVLDLDAVDQPLYITRTDYALKYSSLKTGQVLWYLMFANIEASSQCQGSEDSFGGASSEGDAFGPKYKGDMQLPLYCQTRPVVYRIRDINSLDNLLVSGKLPNADPGGRILPLPALDLNPLLKPLDKLPWKYQSHDGETVLALPLPETEDSGILALPGGDSDKMSISFSTETMAESGPWLFTRFVALLGVFCSGKMNISFSPETMAGSSWWLFFLFVALLVLVYLLYNSYLAFARRNKPKKHAEDSNGQVVMSKKKKARKSGINQNSTSIERRQKFVSHENPVADANGVSHHSWKADIDLPLTFSNNIDSLIDGRKIGKMFVSNKEIAKGSNGTIVLEGIYEGRPVAVKRLVQTHHDVALKEIQNLIASDQHPNIVRWYGVEYDQDFVYLCLERCTCSLQELVNTCSISYEIEKISKDLNSNSLNDCTVWSHSMATNDKDFELWKADGCPSPQLLKLMRDIVFGLAHLHELGIIHRDLKPQNVLVIKGRSICAKLSDMGISKRLTGDMSSLTKHATGFGSSGWQAPEQLLHERQTRAVDLFSLGCLLFFCITGGKHPFGGSLERDVNIVKNCKDLFLVENNPEALDLISGLLDPNPELRPKAVVLLHHPFFWNPEMRLSFLRDASDRVELEDRENDSELLKALESIGTVALGGKWKDKMDSAFINDMGRYRRYKFDSVRDLLRVIRNKLNHYRELPKEIQGILGQVPEGFENYFSSRFPKLLIEVYRVLHKYCSEEEFMHKYLEK